MHRYFLAYLLIYFPTYLLTHSMQQSPSWEVNRFSASQKIPRILWNPRDHHRIHKCPPSVLILSQIYPVHETPLNFLKIHFKIILPSTPGSPKQSLSLTIPHRNPVYSCPLTHIYYMSGPSHSSWFYYPNNTGERYRSLSSSLCSLLCSLVTSSLLGPNILLNTLFSNTLSLCSSLNVSDQVSHPYKTTGEIIFLHILILKFLDSKLEDERFCTKY